MKVCQLCAVDFTVKSFLLPLAEGMSRAGWDVTVICSDGPAIPEIRGRGVRVETVPIARSMNPFLALRSLLALVWVFRRERFDVLHAHTPVAALIGRVAAWIAGVPFVVYTAHGFYFHDEMQRWKRSLFVGLERFAGGFTHLLFSQSAEDAETAIAEGIAPAERVLAIGNGIDIDRFDPTKVNAAGSVRQELGIPGDAYVVGFIGRFVREKGIAELLAAAAMLADAHREIWFLLVGEKLVSDHAEGVEQDFLAAKSVLGDRLVMPGLRDDIPRMLSAMDVFCLPSWREGMPRTIIEAMMMGKPVIASDIRGAREEVVSGETGLLVPTRSPGPLVAAISTLAQDRAKGRELGEAGRRRALQLYDERKVVSMQIERITRDARRCGLLS